MTRQCKRLVCAIRSWEAEVLAFPQAEDAEI